MVQQKPVFLKGYLCNLLPGEPEIKKMTQNAHVTVRQKQGCYKALRRVAKQQMNRLFTVLYFFRKIVEIERFALRAAILHECQNYFIGGGVGLRGSGLFEKVHLKIQMAAIAGKTRYISTISRRNRVS